MKYYVVLKSKREAEEFYRLHVKESEVGAFASIARRVLDGWCDKVYVEVGNGIGYVKDRPNMRESSLTVTLEQYLALQAKKPTQERITAEEVIKVLTETRKYEEIFGGDHSLHNLFRIFTPREIVSKIADWRDKQVKVKVNEDMIADALDEKFGVGKWTREEN